MNTVSVSAVKKSQKVRKKKIFRNHMGPVNPRVMNTSKKKKSVLDEVCLQVFICVLLSLTKPVNNSWETKIENKIQAFISSVLNLVSHAHRGPRAEGLNLALQTRVPGSE